MVSTSQRVVTAPQKSFSVSLVSLPTIFYYCYFNLLHSAQAMTQEESITITIHCQLPSFQDAQTTKVSCLRTSGGGHLVLWAFTWCTCVDGRLPQEPRSVILKLGCALGSPGELGDIDV